MRACLFALIILSVVGGSSRAEIEKIASPDGQGFVVCWWPNVTVPQGWHRDQENSYFYKFNALAPDGRSFADAETVMYARAVPKANEPDVKSLGQVIERDKQRTLAESPDVGIKEASPLKTADGKAWRSLIFTPKGQGNWERVSYGEEGAFYLLFVISARSSTSFSASEKAYEDLIRAYRE